MADRDEDYERSPRSRSRSNSPVIDNNKVDNNSNNNKDYSDSTTLFFGNLPPRIPFEQYRKLFILYGEILMFDLKHGYAFIQMATHQQCEIAINNIHEKYINNTKVVLKYAESKQKKRDINRPEAPPNKSLFIVNFNPSLTTRSHIEEILTPYGNLVKLDMKRSFCFAEFETLEESTKACKELNGYLIHGSPLTVEYLSLSYNSKKRERHDRSRSPKRF